jgi:von Willebrand factor type A domain
VVLTTANGYRANVPNWVITIMEGSSLSPGSAAVEAGLTDQIANTSLFAIGLNNAVPLSELNSLASTPSYVFRFNYSDLISGFAEQFICSNLVVTGMLS